MKWALSIYGKGEIKMNLDKLSIDRKCELFGALISVIEEFLEKKGITTKELPNSERDDDEETDNCALIYGSDYDELENEFARILGISLNSDCKEKYSIVGLQYSPDNFLTEEGCNRILNKLSSNEFEILHIDGNNSISTFFISSSVFKKWTEEDKITVFRRKIAEILNDTEKESPNNVYEFFGVKTYFDYL